MLPTGIILSSSSSGLLGARVLIPLCHLSDASTTCCRRAEIMLVIMAAQYGRPLYFAAVVCYSIFFFFSSPIFSGHRLDSIILQHMMWPYCEFIKCEFRMQVCNVLHVVRGKYRMQKFTIAELLRAISSQLRHMSTIGKNLLNSSICYTCPHNMVNFGPLTAEIGWQVWSTPANFNGFAPWLRYCTDVA